MVERLELYPYSSFPLYWDDLLPAPACFGLGAVAGMLPEPFEKNNSAYCMYFLTYAQNPEEDEHVEDIEPPMM